MSRILLLLEADHLSVFIIEVTDEFCPARLKWSSQQENQLFVFPQYGCDDEEPPAHIPPWWVFPTWYLPPECDSTMQLQGEAPVQVVPTRWVRREERGKANKPNCVQTTQVQYPSEEGVW